MSLQNVTHKNMAKKASNIMLNVELVVSSWKFIFHSFTSIGELLMTRIFASAIRRIPHCCSSASHMLNWWACLRTSNWKFIRFDMHALNQLKPILHFLAYLRYIVTFSFLPLTSFLLLRTVEGNNTRHVKKREENHTLCAAEPKPTD